MQCPLAFGDFWQFFVSLHDSDLNRRIGEILRDKIIGFHAMQLQNRHAFAGLHPGFFGHTHLVLMSFVQASVLLPGIQNAVHRDHVTESFAQVSAFKCIGAAAKCMFVQHFFPVKYQQLVIR